jgi:hypothetical protein
MKYKKILGTRARGFKFDNREDIFYRSKMDEYIGKIGYITGYTEENNSYKVEFKDDYFFYPADQIEAHLVGDWIEGEEYEFSNNKKDWEARRLITELPKNFKNRFIVEYKDNWTSFEHIRPTESDRKVKEQIAKLEEQLNKLRAKA